MSFAGQGVQIGDGEGSVWHPRCSCSVKYANCRGSCLLAVSALSCLMNILFCVLEWDWRECYRQVVVHFLGGGFLGHWNNGWSLPEAWNDALIERSLKQVDGYRCKGITALLQCPAANVVRASCTVGLHRQETVPHCFLTDLYRPLPWLPSAGLRSRTCQIGCRKSSVLLRALHHPQFAAVTSSPCILWFSLSLSSTPWAHFFWTCPLVCFGALFVCCDLLVNIHLAGFHLGFVILFEGISFLCRRVSSCLESEGLSFLKDLNAWCWWSYPHKRWCRWKSLQLHYQLSCLIEKSPNQ